MHEPTIGGTPVIPALGRQRCEADSLQSTLSMWEVQGQLRINGDTLLKTIIFLNYIEYRTLDNIILQVSLSVNL